MEKKEIRRELLQKRDALDPNFIAEAGAKMMKQLFAWPLYQQAHTVMLYQDFRNEAPTEDLVIDVLFSGRKLILPLTDHDFDIIPYAINSPENEASTCITDILHALKISELGILEPDPAVCLQVDPKSIDLVIIPGVAFDSAGYRIGYGKGCYDRFLPQLQESVPKVGLAYDFQVLNQIPTGDKDVRMDYLLTESKLMKISR